MKTQDAQTLVTDLLIAQRDLVSRINDSDRAALWAKRDERERRVIAALTTVPEPPKATVLTKNLLGDALHCQRQGIPHSIHAALIIASHERLRELLRRQVRAIHLTTAEESEIVAIIQEQD